MSRTLSALLISVALLTLYGTVHEVLYVARLVAGTVGACAEFPKSSGDPLSADNVNCLDTNVRNDHNTNIANVNVAGNAGINGFKIDPVFAEIRSTQRVSIAAPSGLVLGSLGSTTRLVSVFSTLVLTDGLRLQSNHDYTTLLAAGSIATPPAPNTMYANTFVKAMALYSASQIDTQGILLASFNVGLISRISIGRTLVSLLTPMGSDFYVAQATPAKIGNDRNVDQVFHTALTSLFGTFGAYRRQYFEVITVSNNAYADNSFSLVVIGQ